MKSCWRVATFTRIWFVDGLSVIGLVCLSSNSGVGFGGFPLPSRWWISVRLRVGRWVMIVWVEECKRIRVKENSFIPILSNWLRCGVVHQNGSLHGEEKGNKCRNRVDSIEEGSLWWIGMNWVDRNEAMDWIRLTIWWEWQGVVMIAIVKLLRETM